MYTFIILIFSGLNINPPQPCQPGFYCPLQSPAPNRFPCPAGTYSTRADLKESAECTVCPESFYCTGQYQRMKEREREINEKFECYQKSPSTEFYHSFLKQYQKYSNDTCFILQNHTKTCKK